MEIVEGLWGGELKRKLVGKCFCSVWVSWCT